MSPGVVDCIGPVPFVGLVLSVLWMLVGDGIAVVGLPPVLVEGAETLSDVAAGCVAVVVEATVDAIVEEAVDASVPVTEAVVSPGDVGGIVGVVRNSSPQPRAAAPCLAEPNLK